MDRAHLKLKMEYKQKKKVQKKLEFAVEKNLYYKVINLNNFYCGKNVSRYIHNKLLCNKTILRTTFLLHCTCKLYLLNSFHTSLHFFLPQNIIHELRDMCLAENIPQSTISECVLSIGKHNG